MAKVSLRAYNREIETMIDRGQLDEAVAHCHHILKTFPKHLDTYRLLGKAYLESKRHGDAADIFLRILASVPNDFVAQVGMSIIRDEENKLDDAIWHMERAFETQPSNPAIQSELQRLYGRRDGVQPPRIRMTRGALAHMYVQGELYPQAISEIRSVLKDDAGRFDMQTLLARACYKSGLKNEAADVASAVLRRYPHSLDANRVLAEILGAERPENAQVYRQRVVELDPYAAQVTGTMFQSNEVPEAAVGVEKLDWNGQPVSMQSDWGQSNAIALESGVEREEQPEWLKGAFGDATPAAPSQPTPASMFDTPASSQTPPAQPAEEIPDFLRAAGWGQSTGAFDESKSVFSDDAPASGSQAVEADLPDWVKAMKPAEPEPAQEPEEELPDWINNIGKGALSSETSDQPDWISQPEQSSLPQTSSELDWMSQVEQPPATPTDEQPDWMSQLGQTPAVPADDQPDWLKNLGSETEAAPSTSQTDQPDWLKGFGSESDFTPQPAQTETPDWLKELDSEPLPAAPTEQAGDSDWLKQLDAATAASEESNPEFDFLNQLTEEPVLQTPDSTPDVDKLGVSEQERDDSFAWLEALAAKQGATEGLLTKPEERLEEEPEWVKQAKGMTTQPPAEQPPVSQPAASVEDIGKTEQEQDDAFAWLENLAAKQGATEGLLTKPEERLEEEPDWIKQAKGMGILQSITPEAPEPMAEQPTTQVTPEFEQPVRKTEPDDVEEWLHNLEGEKTSAPVSGADETDTWLRNLEEPTLAPAEPVTSPSANLEEIGKTEQEQDDAFAWLENLAAKQGATEGLLTKPEDRLEQEPDWVRQAKDLSAQQPPVSTTPEPEPQTPTSLDDTGMWLRSLEAEDKTPEPTADETATWLNSLEEEKPPQPEPTPDAVDETATWLKSLEDEKVAEYESRADETASWLKNRQEVEPVQPQPAESMETDLPAWMQNLEREETVEEFNLPVNETPREAELPDRLEEPVAAPEARLEEESIPSWLAELDTEEEKPVSAAADDDLPAWLRVDEAPPAVTEPARSSDWRPADKQPDIIYSPPLEEPKQPEIIYSPPLDEPQPEPVASVKPQEEPFALPKELTIEPQQPAPTPEPAPQPTAPAAAPEPASRRVPGVVIPTVDPVLGSARNELSRSNLPGALDSYAKLIRKGRYLDEVIYDLRDALYRYPVEVNIWQSLGDAYMRANRLQDALDAYTKAEELLR